MPIKNYSQITHVGLVRENNEDAILCNARLGLWLVADGMGGHAAGEVASAIAKKVIEQQVSKGKPISAAINSAHQAVLQAAQDGEGKYGMGSTVVALKSNAKEMEVAWVGDSRAYLWTDNSLQPLTVDHSYVQMLYQSGLISAEEMISHPEKNVITQCLGSTELDTLKVDTIVHRWRPADWVLLCSDGLTDGVNDQEICNILHLQTTPESAVKALLQAALDKGGKDNVSIIIVAQPKGIGEKISAKWKAFTQKSGTTA